jgi:hypothetical protein
MVKIVGPCGGTSINSIKYVKVLLFPSPINNSKYREAKSQY